MAHAGATIAPVTRRSKFVLGIGAFVAVLGVSAVIIVAVHLVMDPRHVHIIGQTAQTRSASGFTDQGILSKTLSYPLDGDTFAPPTAAQAAAATITSSDAFAMACKDFANWCTNGQATVFLASVTLSTSFGTEAEDGSFVPTLDGTLTYVIEWPGQCVNHGPGAIPGVTAKPAPLVVRDCTRVVYVNAITGEGVGGFSGVLR